MHAENTTPAYPSARVSFLGGVITALATPFQHDRVDFESLERLVEQQCAAGVTGIAAVGTTGESPTLDNEEHIAVIRRVAEVAKGRVAVLAGTGSNSTREAVELTRQADRAGADGILLVAPYYNKPSQEGLFRHFSEIAAVTDKPILLYSIPSRCGIAIGVETQVRLHERFPHVAGVKEAGGSCDRVAKIRRAFGPDYAIMSGDDSLTLPFMSLGATGVVSVASNLVPKAVVGMVEAFLDGQIGTALARERELHDLFDALFFEPNPVPVKHALARWGRIAAPDVRLPLCEMSPENQARVDEVLDRLSLRD